MISPTKTPAMDSTKAPTVEKKKKTKKPKKPKTPKQTRE
jgi:hypothetical protein